jgi:hypothetical protein
MQIKDQIQVITTCYRKKYFLGIELFFRRVELILFQGKILSYLEKSVFNGKSPEI